MFAEGSMYMLICSLKCLLLASTVDWFLYPFNETKLHTLMSRAQETPWQVGLMTCVFSWLRSQNYPSTKDRFIRAQRARTFGCSCDTCVAYFLRYGRPLDPRIKKFCNAWITHSNDVFLLWLTSNVSQVEPLFFWWLATTLQFIPTSSNLRTPSR